MTRHFTDNDYNLLKALATSIGIPNISFEVEDGENEKDTLVIEYSEYITYLPEDEQYTAGGIVHFPGSFYEPPDEDYLERKGYDSFADAVQDVILHIATERINTALEVHWLSNLPSDLPRSPMSALGEESIPMYGFEGVDA